MAQNYYKKGSFNRIDDRTGFKKKAEDTREEWTGAIVATESWEPRNAQDFVRGVPDQMWVEKPRPEGTDNYSLAPVGPPTSWIAYLGSDGALYPITQHGALIIIIPASNPLDPSSG